jgi:hypothetical protein
VLERGDMGLMGGTELIYDSKTKSKDYYDDMNSTKCKKWMEDRNPILSNDSTVKSAMLHITTTTT